MKVKGIQRMTEVLSGFLPFWLLCRHSTQSRFEGTRPSFHSSSGTRDWVASAAGMYPAWRIGQTICPRTLVPGRPLSRAEDRRRDTHQKKSFSPNTSLDQIWVLIADDHPVAREGLSSILRSLEGFQVVGEAGARCAVTLNNALILAQL